jgi:hypothetical protein
MLTLQSDKKLTMNKKNSFQTNISILDLAIVMVVPASQTFKIV